MQRFDLKHCDSICDLIWKFCDSFWKKVKSREIVRIVTTAIIRAQSRALYGSSEDGDPMEVTWQWQRDCVVRRLEWWSNIGCSKQSVRSPPTASRLLVCGLHFCTPTATCINELPGQSLVMLWSVCTLQCAIICYLGPRLTLWKFRLRAQGGGGWPLLSQSWGGSEI